ncbi:aldo/keto reductase [Bacillus halotolerans]|uniref:aldo/keto reductase n=1 Tax=Bacillus halotolerans TaxID=260554 RepID=UPI002281D9DD|nr:aldo/keto reductase [Bacillus halotolerans]MCY8979898.1 aldo/keto reductase [Bacillus halotolerans]
MPYTLKEVMEQCQMTEDAVRYDEKIGLLPPVKRKANGHRVFSEDDKKRLLFIRCLKKTGMSLEEMKPFLSLQEQTDRLDDTQRELLRNYQEKLKQKQSELEQVWELIEAKLEKLKRFAEQKQAEPAQVALSWLLHQPGIDLIIPGATRPGQLKTNIKTANLHLSEDELKQMDQMFSS